MKQKSNIVKANKNTINQPKTLYSINSDIFLYNCSGHGAFFVPCFSIARRKEQMEKLHERKIKHSGN